MNWISDGQAWTLFIGWTILIGLRLLPGPRSWFRSATVCFLISGFSFSVFTLVPDLDSSVQWWLVIGALVPMFILVAMVLGHVTIGGKDKL